MDLRSRNKLRYNEREVEEEDIGFSLHTAQWFFHSWRQKVWKWLILGFLRKLLKLSVYALF